MFTGLSRLEVVKRKQQYGKNILPTKEYSFLTLLGRQLKGIFNILLFVAVIVTFALGEPVDASFILFFIVVGVGLGLFQEHKSNTAAEKLKSYLVNTITVIRDSKECELPVADIVPGDILKLETGDIVPADCVIRQATGLRVDETTFTGESVPVVKIATDSTSPETENILLQGVTVISGTAFVEVTATATKTKLAQIAKTVASVQNESELTKGMDRISFFVMKTTFVTLAVVILANIFIEGRGIDIPQLLIFSIALAISVIPEALPLVMTFSLSRGALILAKKNVIVKRLSSVQDLGSIELLCTDKTGTITDNHLVYQNNYLIPHCPYHPLLLARLASNDLAGRNPEPFDHAVDEALDSEQRNEITRYELIEEESFDPAIRSNGSIVKRDDGRTVHIRRGSPEYFFAQGLIKKVVIESWMETEENLGRRVLGVSYDDGRGPKFGGFLSFVDTIKKTTKSTIEAAKKLNVAITIVTGDSLRVAEAVGRETGLITTEDEVIEASIFFALSADKQNELASHIRVFARTTPEQKLQIIKLLKTKFTVGFLGEGINDAPALKMAHVSMVVQSASDVARETADIILLKSNLNVIIDGIRHGRETHANTLKYLRATLVSNFGNFYSLAISSLFITFLPMLPKQILLLNLLSDVPMMAIAYDNVSATEVAQPQRYNFRSMYMVFIVLGLVSTCFDFLWFFLFYKISPEVLQTNWFIASVLTEILLVLSIRSMLPIEKAGRPANVIIYLSIISIACAIAIPLIPVTATFFAFTTPTWSHLGLIVSLALVYVVVSEIAKRILVKFMTKHKIV